MHTGKPVFEDGLAQDLARLLTKHEYGEEPDDPNEVAEKQNQKRNCNKNKQYTNTKNEKQLVDEYVIRRNKLNQLAINLISMFDPVDQDAFILIIIELFKRVEFLQDWNWDEVC